VGRQYDDEQIAKLRQINQLLQQALNECQRLVRQAEIASEHTGQDNAPTKAQRRP
jgi:hypothetical protein